jgi:hypothetical protein
MDKGAVVGMLRWAIVITWFLSVLITPQIMIRRGFRGGERYIPGCLLGPLGLIIALLLSGDDKTQLRLKIVAQIFVGVLFTFLGILFISSFIVNLSETFNLAAVVSGIGFLIFGLPLIWNAMRGKIHRHL